MRRRSARAGSVASYILKNVVAHGKSSGWQRLQPALRAWQALRDVSGFHKVVELPQEAHGYFYGSQQTSDTLWRASKHPTSVFFLMSERAAAACPVTIPKERRLREAFGRPV